MERSYEKTLLNQAVVAAGTCVELPFPNNASLTKLVVIPTGGTPGAFTVDVYSEEAACDAGAQSPLYQILPQQSSGAGGVQYFEPRGHPVFGQRKIYIYINPAADGVFAICVGGRSQA